mgnify:FL=1
MFKSTYLLSMPIIFLSACGLSKSATKLDVNADDTGWHCSANAQLSPTWNCVQNTNQKHKLVATKDMITDSSDSKIDLLANDALIIGAEPDISSTKQISVSHNRTMIAHDSFQVQLGAYSSRKLAVMAAQKFVFSEELRITQLWSKQRSVFVILYGYFSSRDKAEQAVLFLTQTSPDLAYWIRPTASIDKARIQ